MEKQIEQLTTIVTTLCEAIVKDDTVKAQLAQKINEINQNDEEISESNQESMKENKNKGAEYDLLI